jgi:ribosomal protein L37AE/L43A
MPKQLKIELPVPHAGQRQIFTEAARFNVLSCGRRWGKSTLGIDRIVRPALEAFPCGWFAPNYKNLLEAWRALQEVLAPVITSRNNAEYRLETRGGGSITMFSLDSDVSDTVRGRAFKTVVIDEAALVRSLRTVWENGIRPTLADHRGDAWFLSTPRGMNDFKTFYDRGQDPERDDWASWCMPTSTNPHIAPEEIEAARLDMTEAAFSQEFLAAFVNWEGAVFRGVMECATAERKGEPEAGHEYVIGADWGRSNDYTVFSVVDITARAMVDIDRSNRVDYVLQRGRLQALCDRWRPSKVIAESNSIGQPIIEELQRAGLPVQAFTTTNASKAEIIEALALAFEQRSIAILNDPVLLGELQAFAAEQLPGGMLRYAAPGEQHDDCVMSLALAWSIIRSGMPYGLTAYLAELQAELTGQTEERMKALAERLAAAGAGGVIPKNAGQQPTEGCPQCGATTCITQVSSGGWRCGACAHQWGRSGMIAPTDYKVPMTRAALSWLNRKAGP